MSVNITITSRQQYLADAVWEEQCKKAAGLLKQLIRQEDHDQVLGWRSLDEQIGWLEPIRTKAAEIRANADVFVIVGVGGSNQAARAMIEAIKTDDGPQIVYLGNTLSPFYISRALAQLEGKRVYINVIAKNFETLEPGSHFRLLRDWMRQRYTPAEMADRIIITGTAGTRLEKIAAEQGYLFLPFPVSVGGRYSAFSPVCLLPIAAAGLDLDAYLAGARTATGQCHDQPADNPAIYYAAARNLFYELGYDIELLVSFEPQYSWLTKWWVQLFGESEGKDHRGIFPAAAIYSEDLHSIGQYLQAGRRNLQETFLRVKDPAASVVIASDPEFGDQFDYLDGMDFARMNQAAAEATLEAHISGGVPCMTWEIDRIDEHSFGELFYYFMMACAVSGRLMGINPFDQEGVEAYKQSMFAKLGKKTIVF